MWTAIRAARLLWPGLMTLAGVALLLGLGTWQLHRKEWKEGLIRAIEQRTKADPVSLGEVLKRWRAGEDVEYVRVEAQGRFLHESEFYLYAPSAEEGPGYHVYTPMVVFSAEPAGGGAAPKRAASYLIVNRGFVPERFKASASRAAGQINDRPIEIPADPYHQGRIKGAAITGLLRTSETKGTFTPENDVKANLWYWRDLDGMSKSLEATNCRGGEPGVTVFCAGTGLPFFLDLEVSDVPGGWPRGGVTRTNLPNRHLEYALTWFALAGTLLAVFVAFWASRLRSLQTGSS